MACLSANSRRSSILATLRDRRGVVAVAFVVGSAAVLGMAALATEGGVWLANRRNAQNAADAGAYAGVLSMALRGAAATGNGSVASVARDVMTRNGFTNGTANTVVTVDLGRWSGGTFTTPAPTGSSPNAVRTSITRPQATGLARLISTGTPVAWGGAVAVLDIGGPACTLSIPPPNPTSQVGGSTNISGSAIVDAPDCLIVANATGRRAINIQNTAAAEETTAAALRASGQCYNCNAVPSNQLLGGYTSGAPLTPNPYAAVDQAPMPSFTGGDCVAPTYLNAQGQRVNANQATQIRLTSYNTRAAATYAPYALSTPSATCTNISVGSGQTLTLTPGTYFFNNASLTMSATSARIVCSGCTPGGAGVTLVFTGSSANGVGNIQITGGQFTLIAPGTNNASPDIYQGIAIYRDDLGRTSNSANDMIKITGNPGSTLFGAIYAPTAGVELAGTGNMNQTPAAAGACVAVVAGEITYTGNTATKINACETNGTQVARVRIVRLAQ